MKVLENRLNLSIGNELTIHKNQVLHMEKICIVVVRVL
jgi:hypothetical protein